MSKPKRYAEHPRAERMSKTPPRPKPSLLRQRLLASTRHSPVFSPELKEWLMWDRMGVSFR